MQSPTPSGVQLQPPGKSGAQNYGTVSNGLNMVHLTHPPKAALYCDYRNTSSYAYKYVNLHCYIVC